jgi:DNA-directed RNA polymerase subunit M/transcription elongation factor TFIIS
MAIRYCDTCDKVLDRDTSTGELRFACPVCKQVVAARPEDAHIDGFVHGDGETEAMFEQPIRAAAQDRVTQQVRAECEKCGLDVMGCVRVGESETTVFVCDCGHTARAAPPAPEAPVPSPTPAVPSAAQ